MKVFLEINNNLGGNLFNLLKNMISQSESKQTQDLIHSSNKIIDEKQTQINISNEENLKLILSSMGILYSEKNLDIAKLLLNCSLPINKENLKYISQNLNLFKELPLEKLEFLIKNEIPINKENANILENYIEKNINLTNQLKQIFSNIKNEQNLKDIFKAFNINNDFTQMGLNILKNISTLKLELTNNILNSQNDRDNFLNLIKNFKNEDLENSIIFKNLLNNDENNKKINSNIPKLNFELDKILKNIENNQELDKILKNILDSILPNNIILNKKTFLDLDNYLNQTFAKINNSNIPNNLSNKEKEMIFLLFKNTNIKELKKLFFDISNFQKNILKDIDFDFKNKNAKELDEFLNNIKEGTNFLKNTFENDENSKEILNFVKNFDKNLDFAMSLKDTTYLQIPININNTESNLELFLFKDKKNMKKNKTNSGSALLSLNLNNLGLLETYINKIENNIFCQFRIKNIFTKNLIKENLNLLNIFLKEKNLNLKEVSFKDIEESFSLISKEPLKKIEKNEFQNFNKKI